MFRKISFPHLIVSLLLAAAAILKLAGLTVSIDPLAPATRSSASEVVLIAGELLLALWLASGWRRPAAWLVAVLLLVIFAATNLQSGLIGSASCGCLGIVRVSPWVTLALDVTLLATVALVTPRKAEIVANVRDLLPKALGLGVGTAGVIGVLALVSVVAFGSVDAALAALRGGPITVTPAVDFGFGRAGAAVVGVVEVTNYSGEPVLVYGGTSDCTCVTQYDLPATVPPGGRSSFRFTVRLPKDTGQFTRRGKLLLTDHGTARKLRFVITGRVTDVE
jgi:hypothetical protein